MCFLRTEGEHTSKKHELHSFASITYVERTFFCIYDTPILQQRDETPLKFQQFQRIYKYLRRRY